MLRSPDSCNSTLLKVPVNMIMSHSNNIFVEPFIALNIDAVNLSIQHEGSMFARVRGQYVCPGTTAEWADTKNSGSIVAHIGYRVLIVLNQHDEKYKLP